MLAARIVAPCTACAFIYTAARIVAPCTMCAFIYTLPCVSSNRPVNELLTNSSFDVNFVFGRAKRTVIHAAAK